MSVATEFPPLVSIPERARPSRPGEREPAGRRHLRLVPPAQAEGLLADGARTERELRQSGLESSLATAPSGGLAPVERTLRLTRRGRRVMWAGFAAVAGAFVAVAYLSAPAPAPAAASSSTGSSTVTVQAGDTLWSIAGRVAPSRDPRAVVDDLMARNHLSSDAVVPGQQLRVR